MKRITIRILKLIFGLAIFIIIFTIAAMINRNKQIIAELELNKNIFCTNYGHTFNYTYKQESFFLVVYDFAKLYYKDMNKWVLVDTMTDVEPELKEVFSNEHYVVYCEKNKTHYYVVFLESNKIVNLTDEILYVLSKGEEAVLSNTILKETKDFIVNYMSLGNEPSLNRRYMVVKEYLK